MMARNREQENASTTRLAATVFCGRSLTAEALVLGKVGFVISRTGSATDGGAAPDFSS